VAVRAFSFGGGVQSTAALVLAADRRIDFPLFVYANVGDDHEPETLRYVREVAKPYADEHGIELVEVERGGVNKSLLHKIERLETSVPIPMRMDGSGAPGNRTCTQDFKIEPVARLLKARGATKEHPAIIGLGITVDEIQRVRSAYDKRVPVQRRDYPLVRLELTRQNCLNVIEAGGLPRPPKSACFFCPYHSVEQWQKLRRDRRPEFDRAVALERSMQARRAALGKDPVWLTDQGARHKITLDRLVGHDQMTLDDEHVDNCDEGFCFT
jgi:hypothetical protein